MRIFSRVRFLLFFVVSMVVFSVVTFSQNTQPMPRLPDLNRNRDSLPYKLDPKFPEFSILLKDSVTVFNSKAVKTGKPVALMFFSPECKHCKELVSAMIAGMDSIKHIQFYLMTASHDMKGIRKFYEDYRLGSYKNIRVVGRDFDFFFVNHYGTMRIPDVAIFDENLKFVQLLEGPEVSVRGLYELTRK